MIELLEIRLRKRIIVYAVEDPLVKHRIFSLGGDIEKLSHAIYRYTSHNWKEFFLFLLYYLRLRY